jgi:hypothetical protein
MEKGQYKMKEPDFTNPVDLHAFIENEFGACSCYDMASMIKIIKELMLWINDKSWDKPSYKTLFPDVGIYYLIMGTMEKHLLADHGTIIHFPCLTQDGKDFLAGLEKYTPEEIENCPEGCAYDGGYQGWV